MSLAEESSAEVGEGETGCEHDESISNDPATATAETKATATAETKATATSQSDEQGQQHNDLFHDAVQTHRDDRDDTNITKDSIFIDGNGDGDGDTDRPNIHSDSAQWAAIVNIHKELRHSTGSRASSATATSNATGSGGPGRMRKLKGSNSRRKETKGADADATAVDVDVAPKKKRGRPAKANTKATKVKVKTTKAQKTKKAKDPDPNQPKRPPAAFWLFLKAESAAVQSSYPNLSRSEIVSVMSDAWRTASAEDKQPYVEQHQGALTAWQEQVRKYSEQRSAVAEHNDNNNGDDDNDNDNDNDDGDVDVDVDVDVGSESAISSATTAAATALLRIAGSKQQQLQKNQQRQGRRASNDGCLEPKSKPLQKEDGSFLRPRGAAPASFSWDATTGVWVPIPALALSDSKDPKHAKPKPKPTPTSKQQPSNSKEKQIKSAGSSTATALSPRAAATKTQLPKPKAAGVTANTQRLTDSGCLEAKSKPLSKEDGTFFRPRGAAPAGFSWDATAGLWVPVLALSKPSNKSPSLSNKDNTSAGSGRGASVSSQKLAAVKSIQKPKAATAAAATKTKRLTDGGCMEPKSVPHNKPNGTFARPRGVPPAGLTWDDKNGLWVPQSWSGDTASTTLTRPTSNEQSVLAQPASTLEGGGGSNAETTVSGNLSSSPPLSRKLALVDKAKKAQAQTSISMSMPASKYKFPKVTLTKEQDGSYRRPRGSAPLGHDWDSALGVWVRRDEDTATQQVSSADARKHVLSKGSGQVKGGKVQTSNTVRPREIAPRSPAKEMRHESNYILPKSPLQKKGDGTYLRPRGRAPAGCSWEAKRGAWVTINATPKTASKHPARRSHVSSGEGGVLATDTIATTAGPDSTSQGHPNGPFNVLAPEVRLLLAREGVTTVEQLLSSGTGELAKAYIMWRAQENMSELKGKTSASTYVNSWKSAVRRASAELGIDTHHPPAKVGRPKGSKRNRSESLDGATTGIPRRPLQESQSREKRRRVERPADNGKPTYVACGACKGCRTTRSCGTCLPCKQRIDTLAGASTPSCVHCICIAAVMRPTMANKTENVLSPLPTASTKGFRSGGMSSHRSAVRPTDSVVESLSDHDSVVMDDMSDLESPGAASASLSRGAARASSGKRSHSKALSGADLARRLQQADRFRIQFDDSDDDELQI